MCNQPGCLDRALAPMRVMEIVSDWSWYTVLVLYVERVKNNWRHGTAYADLGDLEKYFDLGLL